MKTQAEQTVLLPDQLTNELEMEVRTDEQKWAVHQEARSEIGKRLKLDVGQPGEIVTLANGQRIEARDYLGMPRDTQRYANKKCSNCYGRGSVTLVEPLTKAQADQLIKENPANEALLHQREPGKYSARTATQCYCMKPRYRKLHEQFATALVEAGLAKWNGEHVNGDGYRQRVVELL